MRLTVAAENPDLGGDLLASMALPTQSLDRRAPAQRRVARR